MPTSRNRPKEQRRKKRRKHDAQPQQAQAMQPVQTPVANALRMQMYVKRLREMRPKPKRTRVSKYEPNATGGERERARRVRQMNRPSKAMGAPPDFQSGVPDSSSGEGTS